MTGQKPISQSFDFHNNPFLLQQNPKQWLQTSAPQPNNVSATLWPLPREYYDDGQLTENTTSYLYSSGGKFPGLMFCATFDTTGFVSPTVASVTMATFECKARYAFRCRRTQQCVWEQADV